MKHIFLFAAFLCLYGITFANDKKDIITVNANVEGRTYEGMGALSAGGSSRLLIDYPEPIRSQILDYLFKPKFGASLNHLKVEVGGDVNSTCGTEPSHQHTRSDLNFNRGYEFWLMKEAKKRNPDIILDVLPWGAPYWIGNGKFYSDDMPEYIAQFLKGAKTVHGLDIDYVGIWNERPYNVEYIKQLRKTLDKYNIPAKIAAADEIRSYWIAKDMNKDPELFDAIAVIGTHYPLGQGGQLYDGSTVYDNYGKDYKIIWKEALDCGKPVWSLEDGPWAGNWNGAKGIAKILTRNYIESKIVKTITWSLISSYHDQIGISQSGLMKANTPWSGNYELQPALWAMAHLTQFVEPGWKYLELGANGYLINGGSYTSLVSPNKKDVSIMFETVESKSDEQLTINLIGDYANKEFYLWSTDSVNYFIKHPNTIKPISGILNVALKKGGIYTLTTTTGQQKGNQNLQIPIEKDFPLPYSDDFNSYKEDQLPKYTSDISGSFEVIADKGNKVLKQTVPSRGIEWMASLNAEPFTVIGDMSLTDYQVSIDVKLDKKSESAYIMGRIPYVVQSQVIQPMGYWLKVSADGTFALRSTLPALKNGWGQFRSNWPELDTYFQKDTQQNKIFTYKEFSTWPKERIALFEDLEKIINETPQKEDLVLAVYSMNSYQIYIQKTLAKGKVNFSTKKWNNLKLKFSDQVITAYVNGKAICTVEDAEYKNGFAGIGSGWHTALFDNLIITK